eukprot:5242222-Karenia_brevis.AAC.1
MAIILKDVSVTQLVPAGLSVVLHPLIPKPGSEPSLPASQRSLSLFSGVYQAWSSASYRLLTP